MLFVLIDFWVIRILLILALFINFIEFLFFAIGLGSRVLVPLDVLLDVARDVGVFQIAVLDAGTHEDLPVDLVDSLFIFLNDRVHELGLAVLEELLVLTTQSRRLGNPRLIQLAPAFLDAHVVGEIVEGEAETLLVAACLNIRGLCWIQCQTQK